jgi:hypothetical protein
MKECGQAAPLVLATYLNLQLLPATQPECHRVGQISTYNDDGPPHYLIGKQLSRSASIVPGTESSQSAPVFPSSLTTSDPFPHNPLHHPRINVIVAAEVLKDLSSFDTVPVILSTYFGSIQKRHLIIPHECFHFQLIKYVQHIGFVARVSWSGMIDPRCHHLQSRFYTSSDLYPNSISVFQTR